MNRFRVIGAVVAMFVVATAAPAVPQEEEPSEDAPIVSDLDELSVLGELPLPRENGPGADSFRLQWVDGPERRAYAMFRDDGRRLAVYDLEPAVPELLFEHRLTEEGEARWTLAAPVYGSTIDTRRSRLLTVFQTRLGQGPDQIAVIHLADDPADITVDRWAMVERLPGFVTFGMTYAEEDDRIYLIGQFQGVGQIGDFASATIVADQVGAGPAIVALDPTDGSPVWVRPIPDCNPLKKLHAGSLIARSELRPALYFACAGERTLSSKLARLSIAPDAGPQQAAGFPVEYFPVPGTYRGGPGSSEGATVFDPRTDRVFLMSPAEETPGLFVFDGRVSAWVGSVATEDHHAQEMGIHETLGRLYVGGAAGGLSGHMVVTNGRTTPVSQGRVSHTIVPARTIMTDPGSQRLFVPVDTHGRILVVEDRAGEQPPPEPVDYDALTEDVEEGADTLVIHGANVNGFASKVHLVGGYENAVINFAGPAGVDTRSLNRLQLAFGTRGYQTGVVPDVDVGSFGVAARAVGRDVDDATTTDAENRGVELPDTTATCNSPQAEDPSGTAAASVTCDGDTPLGKATADASGFTAGGGGGTPSIEVGATSFDTTVHRDDEAGSATTTTSVARDVTASLPDGGSLVIGEVRATARTVAHGRPGTAVATWSRVLDAVTVHDAEGELVFGPVSCATVVTASGGDVETQLSSCEPVVEAIADVAHDRLEVRLPLPSVTATPRGAFAQIRETEPDHLQGATLDDDPSRALAALELRLFMDGTYKSRLVVQLAAIGANSIYTISQLPTFEQGPTDTGSPEPVNAPTSPPAPPTLPPQTEDQVLAADLGGGDDGGPDEAGPSVAQAPVTVNPPQQEPDAAAEAPAVAPGPTQVAPARGPLALLTLPGLHAARLFGVWALFVAAFVVAGRRGLLLQTTTGGKA